MQFSRFLECEFQADSAKPGDVWNAMPATSTVHQNPGKVAKSDDEKVFVVPGKKCK